MNTLYSIFLIKMDNTIHPISNPSEIKLDHFYNNTETVIARSTLNRTCVKLISISLKTVPKIQSTNSEFRQFISFGIANYKKYNSVASHLANQLDSNRNYYIVGDCYFILKDQVTLNYFMQCLNRD